jgi:acyl carrier protein
VTLIENTIGKKLGEKMSSADQIRSGVVGFIKDNFLFGDEQRLPAGADSLIGRGILDSTGILELIDYLEKKFGISVAEHETIPDNLDSVDNIVKYVEKKTAGA